MIGELNGISCDVRSNFDITGKDFRHPRIELRNEKRAPTQLRRCSQPI